MNNYNAITTYCIEMVSLLIKGPVYPHESIQDCHDIIRDHYEKIQISAVDKPSYETFFEKVAECFREEEPPSIIKEHDVGGWLDTARRTANMKHWEFYRRLLIEERKSDMLPYLEADTYAVLDSCMNPIEEGIWDRRGLAYGYVQSGKTANYIGLINKGLDLGYRIVILLTGMTEDLRKQTQDRVNAGIIGTDENNAAYGVGKLTGFEHIIKKGTTHKVDFSKSILDPQVANLSLSNKIIFVIKKNVAVLNNLIKWLKKKSDEQGDGYDKIRNVPFLIIDDEADNASIKSVSKREHESEKEILKAINRNIRIMLSLIEQKSFVAYTATPYSVVLQRSESKETSWSIDGENYPIDENSDLFPEHFIIPIRHGDKYFGIERVFGTENEEGLPVVTQIDQDPRFTDDIFPNGGFFTSGRGTSYRFKELPDSLQNAILHFVVTVIVRTYREQNDHNTMIVHTTHEVHKIDFVANLIFEYLSLIQSKVLHDESILIACNNQLKQIRQNAKDPRFRECFGAENKYQLPKELDAPTIHAALKEIDLVSLHSRKNDPNLQHKNHVLKYDRTRKRTYIVVGGNRLSRGLTIEGLTTSYFVRHSTRKDSLYQMGRWFGYRIGFEDCVRIYTNSDLYMWFREVMTLENNLRKDLLHMNSHDGMTPGNWEIKVARSIVKDSHKKKLTITDPNKLRFAAQRKMAFGGLNIRTKYFKRNATYQEANMKEALSLVAELIDNGSYEADATYPAKNHNLNFKNVPPAIVLRFLNRFDFHPKQQEEFGDLTEFLRKYSGELHSFSIVLKRLEDDKDYQVLHGVKISPVGRGNKPENPYDHYEIGALVDTDKDNTFDIIHEHNEAEYEQRKMKDKTLMRYNLRNDCKRALLIIYTVWDELEIAGEKAFFPALYLEVPKVGAKNNVLIRNRDGSIS